MLTFLIHINLQHHPVEEDMKIKVRRSLISGLIKKALFDAENLLKASFIFCAVLQISITWAIATVVCLLAIYRQLKTPAWNKEYAKRVFENEFAHNLLYICGFIFVNSFKVLYYIPLILHFWIGIAEYLNLR